MSSSSPDSPRCPECGAASPFRSDRCWLCGAALPVEAGSPGTTATTAAEAVAKTFSLSSLFLVMTLAAVAAGVFSAAPGLGIVFAILAAPALVRTIVVTSTQKSIGAATTPGQKVAAFLVSFGVVLVVVVCVAASLVAALATACAGALVGGRLGSYPGMWLGLAAGGIVGLLAAVGLLMLLRRANMRHR